MPRQFWSFDPLGDGVQWHDTAEEARAAALRALDSEDPSDGWSEDVVPLAWGEVYGRVVETERITAEEAEAAGDVDMAETLHANGFDYHELRSIDPVAAALPLATAEQHAAALQARPDVAVDVVGRLRVAGLWETSSHPEGDAGRRTVAGGWCIVEWHGAVREWRFRGCGLPPSGWYPTREAAMAAADAALLSAGWALAGEASRG